jgi:uncharacterized membrane protein YkoI
MSLLVGTLLGLGTASAFAEPLNMPATKVSMEKCMEAALAKKSGDVTKLEFKIERGHPVYEFEIASAGGSSWEYECDANSGQIIEEEQEVTSAEDPLFKSKVKISEEEAKQMALQAHPGKIVETEYEIESDGHASYEFDIQTSSGKEVKLEVDASTGKIIEDDEEEIYQIGKE